MTPAELEARLVAVEKKVGAIKEAGGCACGLDCAYFSNDLNERLKKIEAKDKPPEPPKVSPVTGTHEPSKLNWIPNLKLWVCSGCKSCDPPEPPKKGWTAREGEGFVDNGEKFWKSLPAIEVHPQAVRVRMHYWAAGASWIQCGSLCPHRTHATFLQISEEP